MSHPSRIDPELAKLIIGKKITGVSTTDAYGFNAPVLVLEDGTRLVILSDEEGNDSGVLSLAEQEEPLQEINQPCEIFYVSGGHCGPYENSTLAVEAAKRKLRGSKTERSIQVRLASDFKTVVRIVRRQGEETSVE